MLPSSVQLSPDFYTAPNPLYKFLDYRLSDGVVARVVFEDKDLKMVEYRLVDGGKEYTIPQEVFQLVLRVAGAITLKS